jgi:hypothetical protein
VGSSPGDRRTVWWFARELGSSIGVITSLAACQCVGGATKTTRKSFRLLEGQIDQGYGATRVLAGIDE